MLKFLNLFKNFISYLEVGLRKLLILVLRNGLFRRNKILISPREIKMHIEKYIVTENQKQR